MIRLLFWVVAAPFRVIRWLFRRGYVALVGYDALRLKLRGALPDRRPGGRLRVLLGGEPGPALLPTLALLERARLDRRLSVVLVELGPLHCGLARAEELSEALAAVRAAGKRVVVFAEHAGLTEYVVALGASEIVLSPGGALDVTGVASEVVLLKGLMDKVGVRAQLVARGKYKSARETFTELEMTEASREMAEALVGDLFEQLTARIAGARALAEPVVREALDEGPFLAARANELGLVDRTEYLDQVEARLESESRRYRELDADAYRALSTHLAPRGRATRVALIEVTGHIKSGRSAPGQGGSRATGSQTFVEQVKKVAKSRRVKAIVLRVDSPGGSALASDIMWHALDQIDGKPIVVSMANVAASGGYFVSGVEGATVVACDATVTGSIGVLGGKFDARGLYDHLGVRKELVRRGAHAGYASDYHALTNEELEKLERDIDVHYRDFVGKMAKGRGKSFEDLHALAQGRVWTGRQARERGLVDERGGLLRAFSVVRQRLGLPERAPLALVSPPVESRREGLGVLLPRAPAGLAEAALSSLTLAELFDRERLFALLPFDPRFR